VTGSIVTIKTAIVLCCTVCLLTSCPMWPLLCGHCQSKNSTVTRQHTADWQQHEFCQRPEHDSS